MAFLTTAQLNSMGFKKLGRDVKISDKSSIYNAANIEIGDNTRIDDFCVISAGQGGISFGKFVHIACHNSIIGAERIEIGDFAGISSHSALYSSNDDYSGAFLTNPTISIAKYRNVDSRPVKLGKHVIVGAGSFILPGVTIGDASAIGALSLVTKNIAAGVIALGSPCKVIKNRKADILELEKKFLAEAGY